MKTKALLGTLLITAMSLWPLMSISQERDLPPPQMTSPGAPPPPPGLPIDFGIPGVMAGGLIIGVYFLRYRNITGPTR